MTDYVKTTNFAAKDALVTGNPAKTITGTAHNTEYDNIATHVTTKEDKANKDIANGYAGLNASSQIANGKIAQASVTQHQAALAIACSQLTGNMVDARIIASNVTQHQASLTILTNQLSGTLSNGTVAQSNVTQHQTALSIATSQLTGNMPDARIIVSNITQHQASINSGVAIATSQITSGTLADARVAASNVTQHQSSLAIAATQMTSGTMATARLGSGTANSTTYLRGDSTWATASGGYTSGSFTGTLTGFTTTVQGTCNWVKLENIVFLYYPALSGTSNSSSMTLTGLPSTILPPSGISATSPAIGSNGGTGGVLISGQVGTGASNIVFSLLDDGPSGVTEFSFATSSTKGLNKGCLTYQVS